MSDLDDALTAMKDARPGYEKAAAYSDGPVSEVFVSPKLQRLLRAKGDSFITLLGNVVIDAVADKLKVTAVTAGNEARTQKIADFDKANQMTLLRPEVMRRACKMGDAYLIAWPELDSSGEAVKDSVRVSLNDPRTVRVLYDPENPTVPRVAIKRWEENNRVRVDLLYPDTIHHFISKAGNGLACKAEDFQPYAEDDREAEEPNPFGEIPVFHFTTGIPGEYGTPEHKPFWGTQDTLIKLKIGHMSSIDYHSVPQRYALLEPDTDTSEPAALDEDEFMVSPDGQRTVTEHGEDSLSNLSSEPGSLWYQRGVKEFGEFSTADPKAFLEPHAVYLREGALASSTPLHLFDRTGQIPSGESLKTANAPLDEKAGARQLSFDATWVRFYVFVLRLMGEEDAAVSLQWAPIESTDDTTKLKQAAQRRDIGVPPVQYLREAGYDPDTVKQWLEDGDGDLAARVEVLAKLGQAVASFSSAVSAGVLEESAVQAVVIKLIGDLSDGGTS